MLACVMPDTRGRRPRSGRPSFVEHVARVSVEESSLSGLLADPSASARPIQSPSQADQEGRGALAPEPGDARQSYLVDPDDVARADAMSRRLGGRGAGANAVAILPESALWLFTALVTGIGIGAVTGTICALVVFG